MKASLGCTPPLRRCHVKALRAAAAGVRDALLTEGTKEGLFCLLASRHRAGAKAGVSEGCSTRPAGFAGL